MQFHQINRVLSFILCSFCFLFGLAADPYDPCQEMPCELEPHKHQFANHLFVGPEIYHVHRTREGGTSQKGPIFGVRVGYEHIKRFKFYWGADVLYGRGTIKGHSGSGFKLKSKFTDLMAEGRLGYTFQQKCGYQLAFTPYVGGGYAIEKNNFLEPSPLLVHFRINYWYIPFGFLSQMTIKQNLLYLGLNFKVRYVMDAKSRVSKDPEFGSTSGLIKERMQYRVEVPLTYGCHGQIDLSAVPFYEWRTYGKHAGFPFDFLETKLRIYGILLKFIYSL